MRAHFAGDIVVTSASDDDEDGERIEPQSEQPPAVVEQPPAPLDARIVDFKRDAKNMAELGEFIDEVLQKAETEAVKQQNAKNEQQQEQHAQATPKEKSRQSFTIPDFKNGKVVNRARGLVVRIFDAICNCANNAAAPAQRIKLRGKRASTNSPKAATAESVAGGGADKSETKEKSKKLENAKDKKEDRKKEEKQSSVVQLQGAE